MDSSIWLWIALAILVVGLVIVGIGAAMFVKGMKDPMKKIKGSADNLKERFGKLNLEVSSLTHTAGELQEEIAVKSEKVGVLTDAIAGTKNSLVDLNATVRAVTDNIASGVERDKENVAQVNQWSNTAESIITLPENLNLISNDNSPEQHEALHYEKTR